MGVENPPAFPSPVGSHIPGMTLRDWFAGQVVPIALGYATEMPEKNGRVADIAATMAYQMADALLAARTKEDSAS